MYRQNYPVWKLSKDKPKSESKNLGKYYDPYQQNPEVDENFIIKIDKKSIKANNE